MEKNIYEKQTVARPLYYSGEAAGEFADVASAGVVAQIIAAIDWQGDIPLIAGPMPQYGECAVVFPEKYTVAEPVDGGCPELFFLLEARTSQPEKMLDVFSHCAAAARCGGCEAGNVKVLLADAADGISIKRNGFFSELKMRLKIIAAGVPGENPTVEAVNYPPPVPEEFLLKMIAEKKGFTTGGLPEHPTVCRRMELVRSEYFPLAGMQRITVRMRMLDIEPDKMSLEFDHAGWKYEKKPYGHITCIAENPGSKTDFNQEKICGVLWWQKSIYAEFLIDLADTVYNGSMEFEEKDYLVLQDELRKCIAGTVNAAQLETGSRLTAGEHGLTVRFSGLLHRNPEYMLEGLFAEQRTAVKASSNLIYRLVRSGRWGVADSAVAMETAGGRRCWRLTVRTVSVI